VEKVTESVNKPPRTKVIGIEFYFDTNSDALICYIAFHLYLTLFKFGLDK